MQCRPLRHQIAKRKNPSLRKTVSNCAVHAIQDVRLWILLFAIIRLVNITLPPIEVGHNWRQSTVLMVARNFFEGPFDLMHPKVDMAGDLSGITGMEFPLLNALHAGWAHLLGWSDWYGRLIVLIFSSLRHVEFVFSPPQGNRPAMGQGYCVDSDHVLVVHL